MSEQAFHEAWKYFDLGAKPLTLNVQPRGVLGFERQAVESQAWQELSRLGLDDRDRADDLYDLFRPLRRYDRAFDVIHRFLNSGVQQRCSAMVASVRARATLAVWFAGRVRVRAVPADAMARAVVDVLPDMSPGPGRSVSLRSAELDQAAVAAGDSNRRMADALMSSGVRRDVARTLVEMVGGERIAYAQFGAFWVDSGANRTRAATVTNCFATERGWYVMEENRRGGAAWTMLAPIDKARMEPRVRALLHARETMRPRR